MSARRMVMTSKSLLGRTWRKMSAALTLGVSRMSTRTIVRSLRPLGMNFPFWVRVYLVKCRGWHSAGFPPPVDDQVGSVLDFAQRTRNLTAQLGGYLGWAVSERGVAIDHPPDQLGQGDGVPLRLAGDVAQAVDQGQVG